MPFKGNGAGLIPSNLEVRKNVSLFLHENDLWSIGRDCQDHIELCVGPSRTNSFLWGEVQVVVEEVRHLLLSMRSIYEL